MIDLVERFLDGEHIGYDDEFAFRTRLRSLLKIEAEAKKLARLGNLNGVSKITLEVGRVARKILEAGEIDE